MRSCAHAWPLLLCADRRWSFKALSLQVSEQPSLSVMRKAGAVPWSVSVARWAWPQTSRYLLLLPSVLPGLRICCRVLRPVCEKVAATIGIDRRELRVKHAVLGRQSLRYLLLCEARHGKNKQSLVSTSP